MRFHPCFVFFFFPRRYERHGAGDQDDEDREPRAPVRGQLAGRAQHRRAQRVSPEF